MLLVHIQITEENSMVLYLDFELKFHWNVNVNGNNVQHISE